MPLYQKRDPKDLFFKAFCKKRSLPKGFFSSSSSYYQSPTHTRLQKAFIKFSFIFLQFILQSILSCQWRQSQYWFLPTGKYYQVFFYTEILIKKSCWFVRIFLFQYKRRQIIKLQFFVLILDGRCRSKQEFLMRVFLHYRENSIYVYWFFWKKYFFAKNIFWPFIFSSLYKDSWFSYEIMKIFSKV